MLAYALIVSGCSHPREEAPAAEPPVKEPERIRARVSDRPANENGVVFILEYHRISKEEARWDRSIKSFKKDLQRLYDMGFRPVSLNSYLKNDMDLAPGASPVIFTFDDSTQSQFNILADGTIDPDCAAGIWKAFEKSHPDFPVIASFYVLPPAPWGQPKLVGKKMQMLKEWGCEVGSHTVTHSKLSQMSDEQVKKELADSLDFISGHGFAPNSLALPFGIAPKNPGLLRSFEYRGKNYSLDAALLVGANPAPAPDSEKMNPYRLPRIQAIEGDYGITYWLDKVKKGEVKPYVGP